MTNCRVPDNLEGMIREFSAGGVVVRQILGKWSVAIIEPARDGAVKSDKKSQPRRKRPIFALPKGIVDPGETPEQTAVREVQEETGIVAHPVAKLKDIKYVYVRAWSDHERVFKIVSFYLLLYRSGRIGQISEDMRHEVTRALWVALDEAEQQLSYRGEREVVKMAQDYLKVHQEVVEHAASAAR